MTMTLASQIYDIMVYYTVYMPVISYHYDIIVSTYHI